MDDRKKRGAQKPQPSQHIMKLLSLGFVGELTLIERSRSPARTKPFRAHS